jgi:energy-coupling factor transport system permease protein
MDGLAKPPTLFSGRLTVMDSTARFSKGFLTYIQPNSPFYHVSAVTKIALLLAISLIALVLDDPMWLIILFSIDVVLIVVARIPFTALKPFITAIVSMGFLSVLFNIVLRWNAGGITLFQYSWFRISTGSLLYAFSVTMKLVNLALITAFFLATTRDRDIINGLRTLKFPYWLCFTISLTIRTFSIFAEDYSKIRDAMTSRGVDFAKGSIIQKAKKLLSVMLPLLLIMLRKAEEIVSAVESRAFKVGKAQRTFYHEASFRTSDAAATGAIIAATVAVFVLRFFFGYFLMTV